MFAAQEMFTWYCHILQTNENLAKYCVLLYFFRRDDAGCCLPDTGFCFK